MTTCKSVLQGSFHALAIFLSGEVQTLGVNNDVGPESAVGRLVPYTLILVLYASSSIYMEKAPSDIRLVRQRNELDCGIATAAMIAGVTFDEAWRALAPSPATAATYIAYHERETRFLNEKGWWAASQIVLKTVIDLGHLRHLINEDANIKEAFDKSKRVRLVVAFADGAKPDHTVVLDEDHEELVYDPARGVFPIDDLFNPFGPQTYSGTLGMTSFVYQPGQPIQTWTKTEHGYVPPSAV
jgi:hypothetical protein